MYEKKKEKKMWLPQAGLIKDMAATGGANVSYIVYC